MARTFTHPSVRDITLDGILHALQDPVRRAMVRKLRDSGCLSCSDTGCSSLSPSTLSFHIRVLRDAGIVKSEKKGVEVINTLRLTDVEKRFPGLLDNLLRHDKA